MRRDEVAALAGVSSSYYMRLEQGRELAPSRRVLDAVARVLQLGEEDVRRLYRLAQPAGRRTKSPARVERVLPHLRQLIDSWTKTPAFIIGHAQDILATNPLADALYADFAQHDNVLRMLFLDPAARAFYRIPERAKTRAVADLQQSAASTPDDPRILELVGELSVRNSEFRTLWACEYTRVPPLRGEADAPLRGGEHRTAPRSTQHPQLSGAAADHSPGRAGLSLGGRLGAAGVHDRADPPPSARIRVGQLT